MKLAGKTDVGRVRQENQDDYRAGELPGDAAWVLVCDGMGGARGGREASQSACNVIERCFQEQYVQCMPGEEEAFLKRALISANRFIFQKAMHEEAFAGMGTTAVCALVRAGQAFLCHAGIPAPISTGMASSLSSPTITPMCRSWWTAAPSRWKRPSTIPRKNIITKALGVDYRLEPECTIVKVQPGDLLLLCSDGLTNAVPREDIEQLLGRARSTTCRTAWWIPPMKTAGRIISPPCCWA